MPRKRKTATERRQEQQAWEEKCKRTTALYYELGKSPFNAQTLAAMEVRASYRLQLADQGITLCEGCYKYPCICLPDSTSVDPE